jgi:DNA-binding MarR family transcriptional regulator
MSLLNDLGELALSTRLLRLSEVTRKDVTRIYKEHGIPFESKWFPVLYILTRRSPLSVIELADELGYAHPSVVTLTREMEKEKLLQSAYSRSDGRKRLLSLSPKAKKLQQRMQPLWDLMRLTAHEIYNHKSSLLRAVEDVEEALEKESYYDRYKRLSGAVKKRNGR